MLPYSLRALSLLLLLLANSSMAQPRIAIIIDDLGYHRSHGQAVINLPAAVSCAIIPGTPHAQLLASQAHRNGKEVLIHMPMAAHGRHRLDQGGLHLGMDQQHLQQRVEQAIAELPQARGLNNHMGSALTEQPAAMGWLMSTLQQHQLFFVDSRTSARSVALRAAASTGLAHGGRDIFLDNQRDLASINRQFNRLLERARRQGQAIAIAHPYPETVTYLQQVLPLLEQAGIELVAVSELLTPATTTQLATRKDATANDKDCCAAPGPTWQNQPGT